jgi:hypothetical protein
MEESKRSTSSTESRNIPQCSGFTEKRQSEFENETGEEEGKGASN